MPEDRSDPANNPPGYDDDDPYEDVEIDDLPEWWRRNVETFREHEMRPYRPPTFEDGDSVPSVVDSLEDELDVSITISKHLTGQSNGPWTIRVDDEVVASVERTRDDTGRSIYSIRRKEFVSTIHQAIRE